MKLIFLITCLGAALLYAQNNSSERERSAKIAEWQSTAMKLDWGTNKVRNTEGYFTRTNICAAPGSASPNLPCDAYIVTIFLVPK